MRIILLAAFMFTCIFIQSVYFYAPILGLMAVIMFIVPEPPPLDVYKWIQKKYDFYDKREGGECGEKYTELIFEMASIAFDESSDVINRLYYEGMKKWLDKGQKRAERIKRRKRRKKSLLYNCKID